MGDLAYFPSYDEDGFRLSGDDPKPRIFRKKILPVGGLGFTHPGDSTKRIVITPEIAQTIKKNFDAKIVPHVQVPLVNDANQHVESPLSNVGRVTDLEVTDDGIYATMEIYKHADDFGKTILDTSAFLHMNYLDTSSGERKGATLLHTALTNRPHVRDMSSFEELKEAKDALAASAGIENSDEIAFMSAVDALGEKSADNTGEPENISSTDVEDKGSEEPPEESHEDDQHSDKEENKTMTKEELIAALKEQGVDVEALQAEAGKVAELSAQLDDVNNQLKLSGEQALDFEDLAKSYVELSGISKGLASKVENLEEANKQYVRASAEREVDDLISQGRVTPAQREHMVKLSLTDREMFDGIVPAQPIVKLSGESGYGAGDEPDKGTFASDIERYKAMVRGN